MPTMPTLRGGLSEHCVRHASSSTACRFHSTPGYLSMVPARTRGCKHVSERERRPPLTASKREKKPRYGANESTLLVGPVCIGQNVPSTTMIGATKTTSTSSHHVTVSSWRAVFGYPSAASNVFSGHDVLWFKQQRVWEKEDTDVIRNEV